MTGKRIMITGDIDALVGGGDKEVMIQFAQKYPLSFRPALSARNLLAASSEAADSSRDNGALRNDNPLGIFKLQHYLEGKP
jgi:hypothetical protein